MAGGPRAAHLGWTRSWTLPHAGVGAPRHPCRRLPEGRLAGAGGAGGDGGALSESQQGAASRARGPRTGRCRGKGLLGGQEWGWVGSGWTCEHVGGHRRRGRRVPKQDPSLHSPLDGKKVPGAASLTHLPTCTVMGTHRLWPATLAGTVPLHLERPWGRRGWGLSPVLRRAQQAAVTRLHCPGAGHSHVGTAQRPGTRCAGPQAGWAQA